MAKILVYDSDARSRAVLKVALDALGCESVIATDGYDVVPMAEQHRPSLVILDHTIPQADGFEILKRLRALAKFALTPVIFASATPKFEIEMTIMDAPAIGYVDKPLDAAQLKDAIESLIGPIAAPAAAPAEPAAAGPAFNGEADLDGVREDVIDLD